MNGFLVVLRHSMDDLPVALFATYEAARRYAMTIGAMPCEWDSDIFGTDCSMPCAVAIATFKDCFVREFEIVRELDDGDDDGEFPSDTPHSPINQRA